MIIASYHGFRSPRWAICPVCPTQTRDITSSGRARTGSGCGRGGFGSVAPCPSSDTAMITTKDRQYRTAENADHGSTGAGAWQNKSENPDPADQASRLVIEWT